MTPIHQLDLWKVAIIAFLAMCFQDVLSTCMVIFEAQLNAPLAGSFDVMGWFFGLICSALAIESIIQEGWKTKRSLVIIGAISLANFAGTYIGVTTGALLAHH